MLGSKFNCFASFYILALVSYGLAVSPAFQEGEEHCDPLIWQRLVNPDDPNHYGPRGDRCEGLYFKEVSGSTSLRIASLTEHYEDFDPKSRSELTLKWKVPAEAGEIRIRAHSLRWRQYYRMDTALPPGSDSFKWNVGILDNLDISKAILGVVCWTTYKLGDAVLDLYLPLWIGRPEPGVSARGYQVLVQPGAELAEVFVSLAPVRADGSLGAFLRNAEPLGYGYYPARRPIAIRLAGLTDPGVYYLELGATLRNGGSAGQELFFYHAGQ